MKEMTNKKNIVLHSNNPYLLMRVFTELIMYGYKNDEYWNLNFNPFSVNFCNYIEIQKKYLSFYSHDCNGDIINLTDGNYLQTIKTILS